MILHSKIQGSGKPLLILHGFLGMLDNWKTLANQYENDGFEVHSLDLRNHGRSFHSPEFTYSAMAGDLLNYINYHQLQNVSIIGHSMGGKVAMTFAVSHPEKVDKLIIADIGPKYYPPHHQSILYGLAAVDFDKQTDRSAIEEVLLEHVRIPSVVQFLMKSLYRETADRLNYRFNLAVFLKSYENIGEALRADARYEAPTLFIRGGVSNYILDEDWAEIASQFPKGKLETIPNVGHWLHAERPDLFLEHSLTYLKS
jgi:esterase